MAESQGPLVTTVAIVFAVISVITISLRLFARIVISKSLGTDDWLICVAVLFAWAFIGCTIASVQHGLGMHVQDVLPMGTENFVTYAQIVWLSSIFYNACLGFIKVSVLALYKRLGDKRLSKASVIMMGVIACQAGGNVLACIFQCTPIQAAYDTSITDKKCVNINAFYLANAAVNIFTDILTYTLPIPLVMKLQMPRQQKIGVAVILCLGLFACVSSIVRITYVPPMLASDDQTWVISGAMYWSVIETNVGILASSIPSFKTIISRYAPGLLGSSAKSSAKRSGFRMMNMGSNANPDALSTKDMESGRKKPGLETTIGGGDDGSEEDLVTRGGHGHIVVKTEIVHHKDDYDRSFNSHPVNR